MASNSYSSALRGGRSAASGPSRAPVQDPPLHHIPALSANAVFIDLKTVKANVDVQERNDFLIKDLKVKVEEVFDIWPEPESQLLYVAFFTAEQHGRHLARLVAGVPWSACRGALVHGWAPGDSVTAVRLTGVPAVLPDDSIRAHFSQFGRVTRIFRSKDKVFTHATNGIAHLSIAITPGFTLPAFVSLVDPDGGVDKRMLVHSDAFRRRCSRCGTAGHVAQYCKAGYRAAGADEALWSTLRIPQALLPPIPEAPAANPPPPPEDVVEEAPAAQSPPTSLAVADAAFSPRQPLALTYVKTPAAPVAVTPAATSSAASSGSQAADTAASQLETTNDLWSPLILRLEDSVSQSGSLPLGQGGQLAPTPSDGSATPLPLSPPSSLSGLATSGSTPGSGPGSTPGSTPGSAPGSTPGSSLPPSSSGRGDRSRSPIAESSRFRSRDPRLNRSESTNSRIVDSDTEDDLSTVASARPGRKRVSSGGKGGPSKASRKKSLPVETGVTPSQDIQECASP